MSWTPQSKKLVSVLATSLSVTGASREVSNVKVLDRFPCICYSVQFRKDKGKDVLALLNSRSEVNAITPVYTAHQGLTVRVTDISA